MGKWPRKTARGCRRMFETADANRSLVLVARVVDDITAEYARMTDLQETIDAAQESARYDRARSARDELLAAVERIQGFVRELDDIGVDLADWTLGIVHFPCVAGGREVALCWQRGEAEVSFWHEADSDAEDRKPIETLVMAGASAT